MLIAENHSLPKAEAKLLRSLNIREQQLNASSSSSSSTTTTTFARVVALWAPPGLRVGLLLANDFDADATPTTLLVRTRHRAL